METLSVHCVRIDITENAKYALHKVYLRICVSGSTGFVPVIYDVHEDADVDMDIEQALVVLNASTRHKGLHFTLCEGEHLGLR